MANLDEELLARAEEERQRKEELEAHKQQELLDRQQQVQQQERSEQQPGAASQLADVAKNQAKQMVKKEAYAAASSMLASTAPIWGPAVAILLGIVLVIGLVVFIFSTMVATCNSSVFEGGVTKVALTATGICKSLRIVSVPTTGSPQQTIITDPDEPRPPNGGLTEAEARRLLADANICNYPNGSSRIDCVNANEPQTSLYGIQQATLNEIIRFRSECNIWSTGLNKGPCAVVVTGGTETSGDHAGGPCSHLSGNKIDIRSAGLVSEYIRTKFTKGGLRDGTDQVYINPTSKVNYVEEPDHWDIGGVGCT